MPPRFTLPSPAHIVTATTPSLYPAISPPDRLVFRHLLLPWPTQNVLINCPRTIQSTHAVLQLAVDTNQMLLQWALHRHCNANTVAYLHCRPAIPRDSWRTSTEAVKHVPWYDPHGVLVSGVAKQQAALEFLRGLCMIHASLRRASTTRWYDSFWDTPSPADDVTSLLRARPRPASPCTAFRRRSRLWHCPSGGTA